MEPGRVELPRAPAAAGFSPPGLRHYVGVSVFLALYGLGLLLATRQPDTALPREALLAPLSCLLGVTAAVWLLMVCFRNYAILKQITTGEYYTAYARAAPPDWVERPARTFNNLMQVPTLFYAACAFLMILQRVDRVALILAWIFVLTRAVHAVIYIVWNYLPARFGAWLASTIALLVLWVRVFAVTA